MTRRRRRRHGTGSIERLASGRFLARLPGRRGSRVWNTRADADDWLATECAKLTLAPETRALRRDLRLVDMVDPYRDDMTRRRLRSTTIVRNLNHLRHVLERWGDLYLHRIDGPQLEELVEQMTACGWSPSTIRNRLDRVTACCRLAMRRGWIPAQPLPVVRPALDPAARPDPYSPEETRALLEAAQAAGPRQHACVALAFGAGLRRSELFRVQLRDLAPDGAGLRVPESKTAAGAGRFVPLPDGLAALLEELEPYPSGNLWRPEATTPDTLTWWLRPVWRAAGLRYCALHRCRHTWASTLANGEPPASEWELRAWGGWGSAAVVRRYYHAPPVPRRGPVEALARSIFQGTASGKRKKP